MDNIKIEELLKYITCNNNRTILFNLYPELKNIKYPIVKPIDAKPPIPINEVIALHQKNNRFKKKKF